MKINKVLMVMMMMKMMTVSLIVHRHGTGHLNQTGGTLPFDLHHNKALPKLIATKMLAATSMHSKMQLELGKLRY